LFVLSWLRNRRSWRRFSLRNRERRARSKKHQSIQILLYIFCWETSVGYFKFFLFLVSFN
jgi:hypothetical protein